MAMNRERIEADIAMIRMMDAQTRAADKMARLLAKHVLDPDSFVRNEQLRESMRMDQIRGKLRKDIEQLMDRIGQEQRNGR